MTAIGVAYGQGRLEGRSIANLNAVGIKLLEGRKSDAHVTETNGAQRNLRGFLELCEKHGMMVIMRVGPFVHGEFRNGGLPDWLYGKPFDVREDNPGFLEATRKFFRALHRQMDGHYFHQGGCIIATQIENEYQHSSAPW